MAEPQYTEFIGLKVAPKMKVFFEKKLPNPSEWLRKLIEKEMKK